MIKRLDLLVHIGAPSSRQDDEDYRAQAKAYVEFQGHVVEKPLPVAQAGNDGRTTRSDVPNVNDTTVVEDDPTVFLDDTQLAYKALDSQLATSSLVIPAEWNVGIFSQASESSRDIATDREQDGQFQRLSEATTSSSSRHGEDCGEDGRRRSRTKFEGGEAEVNERTSNVWHAVSTPAEETNNRDHSQSSYLKSPVLDRSSKKRRLSTTSAHDPGLEQPARAHYIPLPEHNHFGLAYIGNHPIASTERASNDNETTSELPTSYSLSDITSESSRARNRPDISQRSARDLGPRAASVSEGVGRGGLTSGRLDERGDGAIQQHGTKNGELPNAALTPPKPGKSGEQETDTSSRRKLDATRLRKTEKPSNGSTGSKKGTTNADPRAVPPAISDNDDDSTEIALKSLSTAIRPPDPLPGQDRYTSHITKSLHFLTTSLDVEKSYKPVSVSRELRPLERGYWLVDCSCWSLQAQIEFWRFLEKLVGNGNVGWGVWCCRGEEDSTSVEGRGGDARGRGGGALGMVKVFCWGEIVKHVYLMLYVASKSQVRKLGLRWVDGEGEVVVQMRGG